MFLSDFNNEINLAVFNSFLEERFVKQQVKFNWL